MKETINKRKRQQWEKIFANSSTNKRLIYKIYTLFMKFSIKKQKDQPNQEMDRRPKKTFLQRIHTDGHKAHEQIFKITNY